MANLQNAKDLGKGIVDESEIQSKVETYAPEQITKSDTAPTSPVNGDFWYDTNGFAFKFYDGNNWQLVKSAFSATGGTVSDISSYRYHVFNTSGTFTVTKGSTDVEVLIVAGGGGGGQQVGGGGGAGGLLKLNANMVTGNYAVTVGAGGAGALNATTQAYIGSSSSVTGLTVAIGGGHGANHVNVYSTPASGGSGGGGTGNESFTNTSGASGTTGQGFAGGQGQASQWSGGGGGGAGGVGESALTAGDYIGGDGGVGLFITGFEAWGTTNPTQYTTGGASQNGGGWFAGGGGGCSDGASATSIGGAGGGGRGFGEYGQALNGTTHGDDGAVNTGGGGGGVRDRYDGVNWYTRGGSGGSGIVIIRYPI